MCGISLIEPSKDLIRLLANGVDHSDLEGAAVGVFVGETLKCRISGRAIALRLLCQGQREVAPETIRFELSVFQSQLRIALQNIESDEISMKARRLRLQLKSFADRFFRLLVTPFCRGKPAE